MQTQHNGKNWFCRLFFLGLFFGLTLQTIAQNRFIDSLERNFAKLSSETEKLDSLLSLVDEYSEFDLSKSILTANYGSDIANRNNAVDYIAKFDFQLGDIYQMKARYDSAHIYFDKAINYFKGSEKESDLAKAFRRKAFVFQNEGNFEKTNEYILKALSIYESLNDQVGIAGTLVGLSDLLYFQEQYEDGVIQGEKAIEIYQNINDESGLANAYQYTADNYLRLEAYEKALDLMDKALAIKERQDAHLLELGSLINSRGNVLKYMERYEEALEAYDKSLKIVEKLNHQGGLIATSANIADVYMRMGKYEEALPLKLRSVRIAEENGFLANHLENVGHLSEIYKKLVREDRQHPNSIILKEAEKKVAQLVHS